MAENAQDPRSKGDRKQLTTRWPESDRAFIKDEAAKLGLKEGSYVVKEFLESHNRPLPQYLIEEIRRGQALVQAQREQGELDLPRTA